MMLQVLGDTRTEELAGPATAPYPGVKRFGFPLKHRNTLPV